MEFHADDLDMLIQPYRRDEMNFAYCYQVYFRWHTHCRRPCLSLAKLKEPLLDRIARNFGIHILKCTSDTTDLLVLASLKPSETIAGCASKLKGQTSKWLRESISLHVPTNLLARGYFACTVGKSRREAVEQYLAIQSEHHGYAARSMPPVYVESFDVTTEDEARLNAKHARTLIQFHFVLATWKRRGVFGSQQGGAIATAWRSLQAKKKFALLKVSFLPDHVHLAVRAHPAASPADLAVIFMNVSQQVMFEHFCDVIINARLERLWQLSAYIGSYGSLATPQIRKYMQNWANESVE